MKICVINFSGNVGKSVVSQHLLKPRLENSEIIAVESINSDGTNDEKIKGKRFSDIMDKVMEHDNAIIDVGASNVEEFIQQMNKAIGSHEEFDYFVVPTIFKNKQITDTVATIEALEEMGIEKERIRVLFNLINEDIILRKDFAAIFENDDLAVVNHNCVIQENELFNRLHEVENFTSIADLVNDQTDYRALIQQTDDKSERLIYSRRLGLRRLATGVERMLDNTYKQLFK
ncbi:StbB family protein [Vibrio parahaemolyticus]|uniref:StbB family protein n=1 Tax=Vibrio parahaemolyticus TaxID=670 RepID=UPI0007A06347|nr:StbB family protein [Vibrio parahaemolyticus]EGQ8399445.1 StbB [Vibrio parahaemolyticus]EGQ9147774.1 StbB [Vibrio parahaemolyticus]EGR0987900.1 StbB [Vibrio parahaemolyticus]EGR1374221.1 StbB [Vibrio parahaemolyticus]EHY8973417.1 StbB [Vibrio parahaemolyticus]